MTAMVYILASQLGIYSYYGIALLRSVDEGKCGRTLVQLFYMHTQKFSFILACTNNCCVYANEHAVPYSTLPKRGTITSRSTFSTPFQCAQLYNMPTDREVATTWSSAMLFWLLNRFFLNSANVQVLGLPPSYVRNQSDDTSVLASSSVECIHHCTASFQWHLPYLQLQASGLTKIAMHVHVIVYDTVCLMKPVTGKT